MELFTIGQLAKRANVQTHRVVYLIRSRGIKPSVHTGNARLFDGEQARTILAGLKAIAVARAGRRTGGVMR